VIEFKRDVYERALTELSRHLFGRGEGSVRPARTPHHARAVIESESTPPAAQDVPANEP
jgi:hypothetical protein